MPKYITDVKRWLSHENRMVEAGEEFETEFPMAADGKPMRLSDTLRLVEEPKSRKRAAQPEPSGDGAEA